MYQRKKTHTKRPNILVFTRKSFLLLHLYSTSVHGAARHVERSEQ